MSLICMTRIITVFCSLRAGFARRPTQRCALNELKAESLLNAVRQEMAGSTVKA